MSKLDDFGLKTLWGRIGDVFVRKTDAIVDVEITPDSGTSFTLRFKNANGNVVKSVSFTFTG